MQENQKAGLVRAIAIASMGTTVIGIAVLPSHGENGFVVAFLILAAFCAALSLLLAICWRVPAHLSVFAITLLLFVGLVFLAPSFARARSGQKAICKVHLSMIGKAMAEYSDQNGDFFPFAESGPLDSLALLYPKYIDNVVVFQCPEAHKGWWKKQSSGRFPEGTALAGAICDYGYTWRVNPVAGSNFAIVADMPFNHGRDGSKPVGFNVLYFDTSVRWRVETACSSNPLDNIFAPELGWGADTDSFIRQR